MIERIAAGDYVEQPWKNGGGLSHEIAAFVSEGTMLWRVAIAKIAKDGPFSDFSGYDRTILALDGGTVMLEVEGGTVALQPGEPFPFAGEIAVAARLTGEPARDLNVITLRAEFVHDVEIVTGPQRFAMDEDEVAFVYAIESAAGVDGTAIAQGDTVIIQDEESFSVVTGGSAAVIRITEV
jgi:uncharacterized protein